MVQENEEANWYRLCVGYKQFETMMKCSLRRRLQRLKKCQRKIIRRNNGWKLQGISDYTMTVSLSKTSFAVELAKNLLHSLKFFAGCM